MSTAIVVGAGFGGIALAIRLQAMGFQTTLPVSYTHLTLPTILLV